MTTSTDAPRVFFAGVDGGGSSTRVLIVSADGSECYLGTAGGCNPQQLGAAVARERLQTAFAAAWSGARLSPQPLNSVFFGIAGLTAFTAHTPAESLFEGLLSPQPQKINWDHDLRIALAGGLSGRPGIVVIAGTGSSCYGRSGPGKTLQVGGWGALLDDVGSGYWLGLELLRHVCRVCDGRAPKTKLAELFMRETRLDAPSEILNWIHRAGDARPEIAKLAALVFRSWDAGDLDAQQIAEQGAFELAHSAAIAGAQLFPSESAEVIFTGGLSLHSGYWNAVDHALRKVVKGGLVKSEQNALAGAVMLALTQAQKTPSELLVKKLRNLPAS